MVIRDGKVAIRHFNSNPARQRVNDTIYDFVPKNNVSLGWVNESDVSTITAIYAKLCCNASRKKFRIALESDVSIHETGRLP